MSSPRNLGDILRLPALGDRPAYIDLRIAEPAARAHGHRARRADRCRGARSRAPGYPRGRASRHRCREPPGVHRVVLRCDADGRRCGPGEFQASRRHGCAHLSRQRDQARAGRCAARRRWCPPGCRPSNSTRSGEDGFQALLDPGPLETFVPRERDLAEILYTSGSTGLPKGVPLTHAGQLWAVENYFEPLRRRLAHAAHSGGGAALSHEWPLFRDGRAGEPHDGDLPAALRAARDIWRRSRASAARRCPGSRRCSP